MTVLTINPIPQPTEGIPFPVGGTYISGSSGLDYSDGATSHPIPSTQTTVVWSFMHPAVAAGPLTIRVFYPGFAAYSATISVVVRTNTVPPSGRVFSQEFDATFA
jgi:hypothetical protein